MLNTAKTFFRALVVMVCAISLLGLSACKNDQAASGEATATASDATEQVEKPLGHLVERYLKPYPDELTAITDAEKVPEIPKAMEAYNAGRYEEALALFPNFSQTVEQAGYLHLYKGVSELMLGKEYDAFKTLQTIRTNMGKAFEISNWYLALNYVGFNNVYEARRKLEEIVANDAYPADMAKDLLNDLPEN